MKTIYLVAVAAAFPLLINGAVAAPSTEEFVQKVAISDMFETQSSQLAEQKAENAQLKSFAERMVKDHSKTSQELNALIRSENFQAQLPNALDSEHQSELDKLKGESAAQFDKNYVALQVKAHQSAVDLFQNYAQSGDNQKLKVWAQSTLPTLQEHLKQAKSLNNELSNKSAANEEKPKPSDGPAMSGAAKSDAVSNRDAASQTGSSSKIKYVTRQAPTDWSAKALIGKTVENQQGDNLGEINNVVLNEKGDVVAVTIGVGGFLGIGEKDVGVAFDDLQFKTESEMSNVSNDSINDSQSAKEQEAQQNRDARFDTEHDDIQIVLDANKDQLDKAPEFKWLDDQSDKRAQDGGALQ